MTGKRRRASKNRAVGDNAPARDRQGKWVRRTVVANEAAAQDFVFDDGAIKEMRSAAAGAPDSGFDAAAGSLPTDIARTKCDFDPAPAAVESHPEAASIPRRILSPSLWLPGAALLLIGFGYFVFQGGNIGFGPFAGSVPRGNAASTTEVAGHGDTPAIPSAATSGARVVIDHTPEPKPTRRAAAAKPATPPPRLPPHPAPIVEDAEVPVMVAHPERVEEDAWFLLAEEYQQVGDFNRAEELYLRIINEGAQRGRASLALGDLCRRQGDFFRAKEFYLQSERLYRDADQQTSPQ